MLLASRFLPWTPSSMLAACETAWPRLAACAHPRPACPLIPSRCLQLVRIAELQRNISSYQSHSRVPIIRHVSASSRVAGPSCAASWPAVVVV